MGTVTYLIDHQVKKLLKLSECHVQFLVEKMEENNYSTDYILQALQRLVQIREITMNSQQQVSLVC